MITPLVFRLKGNIVSFPLLEEDYHRRNEFEAAQEECFKATHDHLTSQDDTFHGFASYATE